MEKDLKTEHHFSKCGVRQPGRFSNALKAKWKFFTEVRMHRGLGKGELAKRGNVSWEGFAESL